MDVPSNIPWQMDEEWNQVLLSLKAIDSKGKDRLLELFRIAKKIKNEFEIMSEPMEQLCSCTCIECEDICCARATIWFDFKDLLYIYFGTGQFPESQIKKVILKNQVRHVTALQKKVVPFQEQNDLLFARGIFARLKKSISQIIIQNLCMILTRRY